MQKLTNKEEEIMHILWKLKKAFVKDIMEEILEDKPHYNTLSTIVRNLEETIFEKYPKKISKNNIQNNIKNNINNNIKNIKKNNIKNNIQT